MEEGKRIVHGGLRVCEEWGGLLHKGYPRVWKGDGGERAEDEREDEAVKHTMIHQLWEFS